MKKTIILVRKKIKGKRKEMAEVKAKEKELKEVEIVRSGHQIIMPDGMSYKQGRDWLTRKETEEETEIALHYPLESAYPLDALVAFHKALANRYGWIQNVPTPGFFGDNPPIMVRVETGPNSFISVPWGRVSIPNVAGFLHVQLQTDPIPQLIIGGKVKQKHKKEVETIVAATQEVVRTQSIYRAKSIKCSWEWERNEDGINFNPTAHCPKFLDLANVSEAGLIFPDRIRDLITLGLFVPITHANICRKYGVPLKRGVCLAGPYGVGKTLTALVTAIKANANGFTFIYLDHVLDLPRGLEFARLYQPAVIFVEDIDRAVEGERTADMDKILNMIDGIDTKHSEIIIVFTTNHVEKINKAFLRPGRLDTVVYITPPDAKAAAELVKLYGKGLLSKEANFEAIGKTLDGRIPAIIREVVEQAKIAAIARRGDDIIGHVMEQDIINASNLMQEHIKLLEEKPKNRIEGVVSVHLPINQIVADGKVKSGEYSAELVER